MNFQLGWYAHAIFVDGQYPAVSGDGRSQSWSESCSLNTVRVQGDEGEDRCEERGSRLRGVEATNLLWGGLCHDPRQQRLLGNEFLHSPGDLWGRGFLVTCPKIRLSTLRRAIQNWWTSMQVGIVILGRHPKTLSHHYRKHPSTAIAFPHPRPLVNMYPTHPTPLTPYHPDPDVGSYQDETWYGSGSSWLKVICAYFMLILSLKMVWGSELAHLSYTLWNYVILRTLRNIFVLICSAGVSMGHPPGDQLGNARIWSSWYLHHWKRVQVAAECLSWGENCCRLLTTHCFSRWVGRQKLVIAFHMFCCSDRLGNIDDLQRIYYYKHYLNQESFLPEIIFPSLSITLTSKFSESIIWIILWRHKAYISKAGAEGNQSGRDLCEGLLRLEPSWQLWVSEKKEIFYTIEMSKLELAHKRRKKYWQR